MAPVDPSDSHRLQRTVLALALLVRLMGLILGDFYRATRTRQKPPGD